MVFAPFWFENGYIICPFGSGMGYVFLRELRECMNVFVLSIANEEERKNNTRMRN